MRSELKLTIEEEHWAVYCTNNSSSSNSVANSRSNSSSSSSVSGIDAPLIAPSTKPQTWLQLLHATLMHGVYRGSFAIGPTIASDTAASHTGTSGPRLPSSLSSLHLSVAPTGGLLVGRSNALVSPIDHNNHIISDMDVDMDICDSSEDKNKHQLSLLSASLAARMHLLCGNTTRYGFILNAAINYQYIVLPEAKQPGSELVSAPALWIQKMWHKLFPLLCEPLLNKSAGDALEREINALLATCNFLMGVPYVVISSDPLQLPVVLRIVVWALDVSVKRPESESSAKLREAALTTLEQLSKQQPELLISHLSTIIPHLLEVITMFDLTVVLL